MKRARRIALLLAVCAALLPARAGAAPSAATDGTRAALDALRAAAQVRGVPGAAHVDLDAELGSRTLTLDAAIRALADATHTNAEAALEALAPLPARGRTGVAILAAAVARAQTLRDRAFAHLSHDDVALADTAARAPEMLDAAQLARAQAVVARIDMGAMVRASALVVTAVERASPLLSGLRLQAAVCTPNNILCIGSDGADVWEQHVQILVDPAGDDVYLNNAGGQLNSAMVDTTGGCVLGGGTTGAARPNLDCTPLPRQVCTYDIVNNATASSGLPKVSLPGHEDPDGPGGGQGNDGSCGSNKRRDRLIANARAIGEDHDSRAVAVAVDLGGSDTYTSRWAHDDYLFDLIAFCFPGDRTRRNTNNDFVQGSALAGIGVLFDAGDGDDRFRGRLNTQGSGHVGGVGILVAAGRGDNHFWADRLSQGNGIAGGIGVLASAKEGSHTYLLDPPLVYRNEFRPNGRDCSQEGRAGQGQGGFGGVGVLWNDGGEATYRAVTHVVQGAAPYDPVLGDDGAPLLVGGTDAQGSGESFPLPDTPGGLVLGAGLLYDRTNGDGSVCPPAGDGTPAAGMTSGSGASTGIDLSTAGVVEPCGTFNLPVELDPLADLAAALRHLVAGAAGIRVVVP